MAKTGLLFLRDCGSMMINNCVACGRPVCRNHAIDSDQGIVCPECAAPKKNLREEPAVRNSAHRQDYYSRYGYAPYYYGHTLFYSDQDYRTFDGKDPVQAETPDQAAGIAFEDDYMES